MSEKEYPKTAKNCEEDFEENGFELMCGKKNYRGEWILCPKCRKLSENKKFKQTNNTINNVNNYDEKRISAFQSEEIQS